MDPIRIVVLLAISIGGVLSCSKNNYYCYHCLDNNNNVIKCKQQRYLKIKNGYFAFVSSTNKNDTIVYYNVQNPLEDDPRKTIVDSSFKIIKRKDAAQYFKYTVNSDSLFITGFDPFDKRINGVAGLFSIIYADTTDTLWNATVNNASVPFRYDRIFEGRYRGDTALIIDGKLRTCYYVEEKSDLLKRKYSLFIDKKTMLPVGLIEEDNTLKLLSYKAIKR